MVNIPECGRRDLARIMQTLEGIAMGRPVQLVIEGGIHRIEDDGHLYETQNGTYTIRIFINGGAKDTGVEAKKPDVPVQV